MNYIYKKYFNIFILFYPLILAINSFGQQNDFNKAVELKKFEKQGGKVGETSSEIYRLTNRNGESRTFYLNRKDNLASYDELVDTTTINVWEIDTTKYNNMFKFWQQVDVANSYWAPLPIADLNNNDQPELYGYTNINYPALIGPVKIFERNTSGIFQDIFSYDSATTYVKGIAHMFSEGNAQIFNNAFVDEDTILYNFYPVYQSDSKDSFPTTFDFLFYIDTLQINNMSFGDLDNNGKTDCAFTTPSVWDTTMVAIAEYREDINNFEEVFRFSSIFESDISGFAIGDFDQDGKTEIVISSGPGNIFVIENIGENQYSIINQFPFPIHNAYMQTATNDIDGNGKPEFWIGGQDFENGITVFQCYEADGDNKYQVVANIELRYIVSFYNEYIQAIDMDEDGKEELIISVGNAILILKFAGYANYHKYKLWYAKLGEATQTGAQFYPTTIADLNGDEKKDLIIPMEKYTPYVTYALSYILRQEGASGIEGNIYTIPGSFNLSQNYPNPYNPATTIRFEIPERSVVTIKVYDVLGNEVATLINEEKPSGNYEVEFNGTGLTSGIYFYQLQAGRFTEVKKMILLK